MSDKPLKPAMIEWAEHADVNGTPAKKVVMLDDRGNQFLGGGFNLPTYDYFVVQTPTTTKEVYVFKSGGSTGTTVATVTINYTDATKGTILSAAMT